MKRTIQVFCIFLMILGLNFAPLRADDETREGLKIFIDAIKMIQENYVDPPDSKKLIEDAIKGMLQGLDPHSSLLLKEELENLQTDLEGRFTGIGLHVTMKDGYVTVISPIEDTPADKAGVMPMDIIAKVDGKAVKDLQTAVRLMRGLKGTKVTVTIVRKGLKNPLEFELIRDDIPIISAKSISLKNGYGYVRLSQFSGDSHIQLDKELKKLGPLKGLIFDLRNNGGGLLGPAMEIADLFLENGSIIMSAKGRGERNQITFNATPNPEKRNYPVVVLINNGTASASEVVAGALQDHKRALILGTTSFGKGSIQAIEILRDGSGLKFTIARYYTPSGRSIQAKGIEPDIVLPYKKIDPKEYESEEDLLKESDLDKHLEAEFPKIQTEEEKNFGDARKQIAVTELEILQTDNQVMEALRLLQSWEIFKNMKN